MNHFTILILIFLGGGIGAILRWLVSVFFIAHDHHFPWGTFIANVLSTAILGILAFGWPDKYNDNWLKWFLAVGLCGGFSTFSTFSLENFIYIKNHQWGWLFANITLNTLTCLAVLFIVYKSFKTT
jgi:CrcB protein